LPWGRGHAQGQGAGAQGSSQARSQYVDRMAGLYVTNPGGELHVKAGNDLNVSGAQVRSEGSVAMEAGHDLNLKTVEVRRSDDVR